MEKTRTIIMGAAGRDFHNFNTVYRNNPQAEVVAFTAAQIPNIDDRRYPADLAGKLYPDGIPIFEEARLTELIREHRIDEVVFAYSDVPYSYIMTKSAIVNAAGADFKLIGPEKTMIRSKKPLIAVCATRTGCGKSQVSRRVLEILNQSGKKVVAIRHPMPYGDLSKQAVQRFAALDDLDKHRCTIEEREEYEPHIVRGNVIYAGVDYEAILRQAEEEADIVVWDGGNNDMPFYKPDMLITIADPHRPMDGLNYYPGEVNLRMADAVIINKIDTAAPENVITVRETIAQANPKAIVIDAASPVFVEESDAIRGKRVLVVEDGPTLTHGGMTYGAGIVAAKKLGAAEIVDPRPYISGTIAGTFETYPNIGPLLPAMGYGDQQVADLAATINRSECDAVIIGTPIDLRKLIDINKPAYRVTYELQEIGKPDLQGLLTGFLNKI